MIGYAPAFSNSWMSVQGAHDLDPDFDFWPAIEAYGGGVIQDWAAALVPGTSGDRVDGMRKWNAFETELGKGPIKGLWMQVGSKVHHVRPILENLTVVHTHLRSVLGDDIPFYLSAVNSYEVGTHGYTAIAWRECATAVSQFLAQSHHGLNGGPVMPMLTTANTNSGGIHPSEAVGYPELGQALLDFFKPLHL